MENKSYGQPPPSYDQPQVVQPNYGVPMSGYGQQSSAHHTTVIVNQPRAGDPGAAPRMWSTGICDMCDDAAICLCAVFCGICLACEVSTDMGESGAVPCCVPGWLITLRTKWRTQENIEGSICDDCITTTFCGACAMCQLAREVKKKKLGTLYAPR